MKKNRFGAAPRVAACALALGLAACGGGGGGGDGGSGGGTSAASGNPVFADNSGPLCSTTVAVGVCSQPTSSAITMENLLAKLKADPKLNVQFQVGGVTQTNAYTRSNFALTSGSCRSNYAVRKANIGYSEASVDGDARAFSKELPTGWRYGADELNYSSLGVGLVPPLNLAPFTYHYDQYSNVDASGNGSDGGSIWHPLLGLLTDQTGAPSDDEIIYDGYVTARVGDCSKVDGAIIVGYTYAVCPVTLSFSPKSGVLKTTDTKCTDNAAGIATTATASFSMDPLNIKGSRVVDSPLNSARFSVEGPAMRASGGFPVQETASADKIGGMVLNLGADGLAIEGTGRNGQFVIGAGRRR